MESRKVFVGVHTSSHPRGIPTSMPSLSLIQPQAVLACYDCFVPVTPLSFQLCNALSNKLSRYPTKTREKILSVFSCILGKRLQSLFPHAVP